MMYLHNKFRAYNAINTQSFLVFRFHCVIFGLNDDWTQINSCQRGFSRECASGKDGPWQVWWLLTCISDKLQNTLCARVNIREKKKRERSRSKKSNIAVGYEKTCSARNTIFKAALNNYHFERSEKSMVLRLPKISLCSKWHIRVIQSFLRR